ncbi:SRPBCC family protein [Streptomyces sp. BH105]|uniref:SRPBCC family protein n=1 Tax=Streptomyces sp. BH105 TaxID=3410408 RepID=UPI003CF2A42B
MKLENTLAIPVAVEDAWRVLLDVERVAPCVPGATLTSTEGDTHHGRIKVKLGPVALTYTGTVTFRSRDKEAKVVVLEAGGREARGNGTAKAVVTCRLTQGAGHGAAHRTDVHVETELNVTGKPAQFGRGTLAEVSGALMDRFAQNLAAELAADPVANSRESATDSARRESAPVGSAAPLDILEATAGAVALKRAAPVIAAAALLILARGWRGRRRHRR